MYYEIEIQKFLIRNATIFCCQQFDQLIYYCDIFYSNIVCSDMSRLNQTITFLMLIKMLKVVF